MIDCSISIQVKERMSNGFDFLLEENISKKEID